ncbi:FG-GAP-like repeat-containing protein [Streptomyces sp. NPDC019890]|uniref:FG-GAP-like repeat-containing protein n=1 Tax=Streptomyces sp. NPDC019890 TaxID=3365064 RepID=UPI00384C2D02
MRSFSSRVVRGALTAGAAAGLVATVATVPAQASSGYDRCAWGKLCVFSEPLGQGEMLVVNGGTLKLGAWDNRISSFANHTDWPVCFYPEPGLDPWGATHYYPSQVSFDESATPDLDNAVSSIDLGPEADDFCGTESRFAVYQWDNQPRPRPAGLPVGGAFGDVNGDGYADLFSRNKFGQLWTSHVDESAGKTRLLGAGWNSMNKLTRHGDHNGDAKEDLFARDSAGVLWFYPGRGDGTFGTRARIGGGWNTMRDLVAAGDLTGDGKADLLAADSAGTMWTYPGNGRGSFGARQKVGVGWKVMNELVGSGDMNSDKRADLVARDTAGKLWFYPGNGKGTFGARKLIGTGGWNGLTELAGLGDVTGDGRPDLVAHAPGRSSLRVYPGTGAAGGGLGAPKTLASVQATHLVF